LPDVEKSHSQQVDDAHLAGVGLEFALEAFGLGGGPCALSRMNAGATI
jgi:hypothetical protein